MADSDATTVPETSVLGRLAKAVESLVNLEVATVVADRGFITLGTDGKVSFSQDVTRSTAFDGAFTRIDLLSGDMLNVVSAAYAPRDGATAPALLDFHQKQVTAAKEVVTSNVNTITTLANAAKTSLFEVLKTTDSRQKTGATPGTTGP